MTLDSLPTRHLLDWLHWYRCYALPDGDDQHDLQAAVTMLTACFISGLDDLPEPLLPMCRAKNLRIDADLAFRAR